MAADDRDDIPEAQHLAPNLVLLEMAEVAAKRAMSPSPFQVLTLTTMAAGVSGRYQEVAWFPPGMIDEPNRRGGT